MNIVGEKETQQREESAWNAVMGNNEETEYVLLRDLILCHFPEF